MVLVKCMECSQEYELEAEDNPSNYQCHCGGNLKYVENHPMNHVIDDDNNDDYSRVFKSYGMIYPKKKAIEYFVMATAGLIVVFISTLMFFGPRLRFSFRSYYLTFFFFFFGLGLLLKGIESGNKWYKKTRNTNNIYKLLKELPEGYYVFSDVNIITLKMHIDHVVIGPNGIFLIESTDVINSAVSGIANKCRFELEKYISQKGIGGMVVVKGIVTITDNRFKPEIIKEVSILNQTQLIEYILSTNTIIKKESLAEVVNLLRDKSTKYSY